MTQQAQIFETSAPSAPSGDAGFVSATTSPQTLVFKPKAVFPNNGPVQQNVFTTGNSAGVDGLVLLQQVIAGAGLFPTIPLPSSVVECDFSLELGSSYRMLTDINFGQQCTLRGIKTASANFPTIITNGFTFSGIVRISDIAILADNSTTVVTPLPHFEISKYGGISGQAGVAYFYDTTVGSCVVSGFDFASFGEGAFNVPTGALTVNLFDASQLEAQAVTISGSGHLTINIYSALATVDHSYFNNPSVNIVFDFTIPNDSVVYQPGGFDSTNTFTDFAQLISYINSVPMVARWTVYIDGTFGTGSGVISIPSGTYSLPTEIIFYGIASSNVGVPGAYTYPSLTLEDGVIFNVAPNNITFTNLIALSVLNTSSPVITVDGLGESLSANAYFNNVSDVSSSGGQPLISVVDNLFYYVSATGNTLFSSGVIFETDSGSEIFIGLSNSFISAGTISAAGSYAINADESSHVDSSYAQSTSYIALQSNINNVTVDTTVSTTVDVVPPTVNYRADTSEGTVAYQFPNVTTVPFNGWGFWVWIMVSSGTNPITFTVNGSASERLMNPDTGVYQGTPWSSATSGSVQGRRIWVEWSSTENAWLTNGQNP